MATFFTRPRICANVVAKTCPHRPQAIKKAKNGQAFPKEKKHFLNEATACTPRHVCLLLELSRKHSKI